MKKLIIVCEEKYRVYGDYLSQLISLDDDIVDNIVGTKDGEVVAQVWLEKEYLANSAHLSSEQYLLFIGHDKLMKEKSSHMKVASSQFGMTYGWLGKQAVLYVDKIVSANEYEDFISFGQKYQKNLEKLIKFKSEKKKLPEIAKAGAAGALAFFAPIVVVVPTAGVLVGRKIATNKKIEAQQYSCEIMKFYIDSLSEFLGI